MRRAARTDDNQQAIVERLRQIGVQVEVIGKPMDLLVCPTCGPSKGQTWVMEIKNRNGKDTITKDQARFLERWPGRVDIVYSADEAVAAVLGEAMA
jgi:hypothetical protein